MTESVYVLLFSRECCQCFRTLEALRGAADRGSTQSCHDLPKQIAKSVARLGGTPFWLTAPT